MTTARSAGAASISDALRVLVVDEGREVDRLADMLSDWQCGVRAFHAASEAFACLGEFRPHVAVIGLNLPDIRGSELAHHLCECREARRLLLVSLSTRDQERERRLANERGFDFQLIKPVDAAEFRRALSQITHDYGLRVRAPTASAAAAPAVRRPARQHPEQGSEKK